MLVDNMQTQEVRGEEQTKEKIINLLERSEKYIWMSSGLNSEFYNDPDVKTAMVNAFKQVEDVRIIIDGDYKTKKVELRWLFEIAQQFREKIRIKQHQNLLHWLIVDGKHFRLERPHKTEMVGVDNLFVIDVFQPIVSDMLNKKFTKWWLKATSIEP